MPYIGYPTKHKKLFSKEVADSRYELARLFTYFVQRGELLAYELELDKATVTETDDEIITVLKKGLTIMPTHGVAPWLALWMDKEHDDRQILIEEPSANLMYRLSFGGGNNELTRLERLAMGFNPHDYVEFFDGYRTYNYHQMVDAMWHIHYNTHPRDHKRIFTLTAYGKRVAHQELLTDPVGLRLEDFLCKGIPILPPEEEKPIELIVGVG
jgi:hypothetical protein